MASISSFPLQSFWFWGLQHSQNLHHSSLNSIDSYQSMNSGHKRKMRKFSAQLREEKNSQKHLHSSITFFPLILRYFLGGVKCRHIQGYLVLSQISARSAKIPPVAISNAVKSLTRGFSSRKLFSTSSSATPTFD